MTHFIKHEPCPKCGSRDNFARYSDGHAYCFGCHHYEAPAYLGPQLPQKEEKVKPHLRSIPDDARPQIGAVGWTWLKKYGIMDSETHDFYWSESKQWLIFKFYGGEGELIAWQARNFSPLRPKPKYLTFGPISDILVFKGQGDTVCVTEDLISAIRVSRQPGIVGMPIFGSNVPLKTLVRLSERFKKLFIWLDQDKATESLKTRSRALQLPFDVVRSIITVKDPKEYSDGDITQLLWTIR